MSGGFLLNLNKFLKNLRKGLLILKFKVLLSEFGNKLNGVKGSPKYNKT